MWFDEALFYQIYPLGLCGAPVENDGLLEHRLIKLQSWLPHLQKLHVDCVFFNPLFDSDRHGYDTRDFMRLDPRLGDNDDLIKLIGIFHEAGIKVMLDGVFNHVGRGFWAFQDVLKNREASPYCGWFKLRFDGNNRFHDGLCYQGWEGHEELVELNLQNEGLRHHLFEAVSMWIEVFQIDGLRLDVAYTLEHDFMRSLRRLCLGRRPDFFLMGEMIHGDYRQIVNHEMLHSASNYGCYKSLYSAFNSINLFEIAHSVQRQNGSEPWALYRGINLMNFVDNHDVERIASIIQNTAQLPAIYTLMFTMPGIPSLYYGSEWGLTGLKRHGLDADTDLRPSLSQPEWNDLTTHIARLALLRRTSKALCYGDFKTVVLTNGQFIFQRQFEEQRILVALNATGQTFDAHFDAGCGQAEDWLNGGLHDFGGGSQLAPYSSAVWLMEKAFS